MDFETLLLNPPPVDIQLGAWYELHLEERTVRMRVKGVYRSHVLFETERGVRECFDWWLLRRVIW